jgi:hypothetical protein
MHTFSAQVDDSFLDNSDEIVTVHKDGVITVDNMNSSKFEEMMQKYLEYSSSGSDNEEVDDNEETSKKSKLFVLVVMCEIIID